METTSAPQIIQHLHKSLNFTPYDVKWIPGTAQFVLCGQTPKATGIIEIYQLNKTELKSIQQIHHIQGIKCSSFGACLPNKTDLAFGDFGGDLNIIDLETGKIFYCVKAHDAIVNCIDGIGGLDVGYGAPEIVTGGRDGCVRVWDPRQKAPVLSLEPVEKEPAIPDAWAVGFGNSYNNDQRMVCAGYDNGDLKWFDLQTNQLVWQVNLQNGVCGLQFDRRDIIMNKLVATTLEGQFHVFDLRTLHTESGFATTSDSAFKSTVWGVKHLPQNRDLFLLQGGNGACNIYKYNYPSDRQVKDLDGKPRGVIGNMEIMNSKDLCQQPVSSFDWHKDKLGLGVLCGLDQTCRVIICTQLNLI